MPAGPESACQPDGVRMLDLEVDPAPERRLELTSDPSSRLNLFEHDETRAKAHHGKLRVCAAIDNLETERIDIEEERGDDVGDEGLGHEPWPGLHAIGPLAIHSSIVGAKGHAKSRLGVVDIPTA